MDEIISALIDDSSNKDTAVYADPEHRQYMRERISELDEQHLQFQKKLLKTVKGISQDKDHKLEKSLAVKS